MTQAVKSQFNLIQSVLKNIVGNRLVVKPVMDRKTMMKQLFQDLFNHVADPSR